MVNKGSESHNSKPNDPPKPDKEPVPIHNLTQGSHQLSGEIADEMHSDSKSHNLSKYLTNAYKPFEYQSKPSQKKLKPKYFYPNQTSKQKKNMINIQNYDPHTNIEYDEGEMLSMFEHFTQFQDESQKLNFQTEVMPGKHDENILNNTQDGFTRSGNVNRSIPLSKLQKHNNRTFNETKNTSYNKTNYTDTELMSRSLHENKFKKCLKTQDNRGISQLLASSESSSRTRKTKNKKFNHQKYHILSKSTNPFSRQENNFLNESQKCEVKQAPISSKSKSRSKRRKEERTKT